MWWSKCTQQVLQDPRIDFAALRFESSSSQATNQSTILETMRLVSRCDCIGYLGSPQTKPAKHSGSRRLRWDMAHGGELLISTANDDDVCVLHILCTHTTTRQPSTHHDREFSNRNRLMVRALWLSYSKHTATERELNTTGEFPTHIHTHTRSRRHRARKGKKGKKGGRGDVHKTKAHISRWWRYCILYFICYESASGISREMEVVDESHTSHSLWNVYTVSCLNGWCRDTFHSYADRIITNCSIISRKYIMTL